MLRSAIKSDIFISCFKLCKMENKLQIKIQLFKQQRKITICFLVFKRTPHSPYTTEGKFFIDRKGKLFALNIATCESEMEVHFYIEVSEAPLS